VIKIAEWKNIITDA